MLRENFDAVIQMWSWSAEQCWGVHGRCCDRLKTSCTVRCFCFCVSYCRLQIELLTLFYLLHASACIFTAEDWDFFIANITWKTKKMQQQWRAYSLATHHSTYYCPGMKSYFTTCVCLWWLSDYTFRCVHMYVHLPVWCIFCQSVKIPGSQAVCRQLPAVSCSLASWKRWVESPPGDFLMLQADVSLCLPSFPCSPGERCQPVSLVPTLFLPAPEALNLAKEGVKTQVGAGGYANTSLSSYTTYTPN